MLHLPAYPSNLGGRRAEAGSRNALRKSLPPAIYFANPRGRGGVVWVQGWAVGADGGALRVGVSINGRRDGPFDVDVERPDVRKVVADAPVRCGFDCLVPVPALPEGDARAELSFLDVAGTKIGHGRPPILSAGDVYQRFLEPAGLSGLQRAKIRNLILNECDRLNRVGKVRAKPIYLFVDPCFSCQLSCPHCASNRARADGMKLGNMTIETFEEILATYGETLIQLNLFNWGEPLLNKRFPEFCERAHRMGIFVATNTNLSLPLTDDFVARLTTSGLDEMVLSIDGASQGVYERYRVGGDLALVLDNIRRMLTARAENGGVGPRLRWQFLVFQWNRHEVGMARQLAHDLGVDEFCTLPGDVLSGREPTSKAPPGPALPMEQTQHELLRGLAMQRRAEGRYFGCDLLYQQMTINAAGAVHPCCYVQLPKHQFASTTALAETDGTTNSERHILARRMLSAVDKKMAIGPDPCSNCAAISNPRFNGHVPGLTFAAAFRRVTGRSIIDFLEF